MRLNRRNFMAATACSAVGSAVFDSMKSDAADMDWQTMSLEARNLAFNNVAHVGAEFARQKTEEWAAASQKLRMQHGRHLDLAYSPGSRTKWDLYPAAD